MQIIMKENIWGKSQTVTQPSPHGYRDVIIDDNILHLKVNIKASIHYR